MTIPQVNGYGNFINPYLAYLNPQMNNWNNYGYYNPAFMGVQNDPQPVSVPQPVVTPQVQSNAVNFKASEQIQKPQKEGLSKGAKWALGIAGTAAAIYGSVVLHRHLTKPPIEKVAKNFSEIFRRDVSKEEALKMTEKYKEIFKIKEDEK